MRSGKRVKEIVGKTISKEKREKYVNENVKQ